jgi:hypothetical protein
VDSKCYWKRRIGVSTKITRPNTIRPFLWDILKNAVHTSIHVHLKTWDVKLKLHVTLFHYQQYRTSVSVLHVTVNNALLLEMDISNICDFNCENITNLSLFSLYVNYEHSNCACFLGHCIFACLSKSYALTACCYYFSILSMYEIQTFISDIHLLPFSHFPPLQSRLQAHMGPSSFNPILNVPSIMLTVLHNYYRPTILQIAQFYRHAGVMKTTADNNILLKGESRLAVTQKRRTEAALLQLKFIIHCSSPLCISFPSEKIKYMHSCFSFNFLVVFSLGLSFILTSS